MNFKRILSILSPEPLIGALEITDSDLKFIQIKKDVPSMASLKLPPEAFKDGKIKDRGVFLDNLAKFHSQLAGRSKKKIYAIVNILGEHVKDYKTAIYFRDQYLKLIHGLSENGLSNTHVSIKPSQLGIEISDFFYRLNLEAILQEMSAYLPESMLEIDAETHDYRTKVREASLDFAQAFPDFRRRIIF